MADNRNRLRKLMDLYEDAVKRGSLAEASNAAARILELKAKGYDETVQEGYERIFVVPIDRLNTFKQRIPLWWKYLGATVKNMYGVVAYHSYNKLVIVCDKSQSNEIREFINELQVDMVRYADRLGRSNQRYFTGFMSAVYEVSLNMEQAETEAAAAAGPTAMTTVRSIEKAKQWLKANEGIVLRDLNGGAVRYGDDYRAGKHDGENRNTRVDSGTARLLN